MNQGRISLYLGFSHSSLLPLLLPFLTLVCLYEGFFFFFFHFREILYVCIKLDQFSFLLQSVCCSLLLIKFCIHNHVFNIHNSVCLFFFFVIQSYRDTLSLSICLQSVTVEWGLRWNLVQVSTQIFQSRIFRVRLKRKKGREGGKEGEEGRKRERNPSVNSYCFPNLEIWQPNEGMQWDRATGLALLFQYHRDNALQHG